MKNHTSHPNTHCHGTEYHRKHVHEPLRDHEIIGVKAYGIAAILNKSYGGLKYELSDKPVVLYIDTEQEKANTIGVKNRVCEMIGWETQKAPWTKR